MRPFRLLLATTVVALGAVVPSAVPSASAAPPVGCYGLPDYPSAFVCVTEFNPGNAIGGGSSVTVPRACAGDCYGPFSVPVPAGGSGSGTIATVTYGGQTYVVGVGQTPGVPPIPQPGAGGQCPGPYPMHPTLGTRAEPYVCARTGYDPYGQQVWYVGTCAAATCVTVELPTPGNYVSAQDLLDNIRYVLDEAPNLALQLLADVRDMLRCESLQICMD